MSSHLTRRVRLDGLDIRTVELGQGSSHVVLLASPVVTAATYLPVARLLAARYRIWVVELPGSGGSSRLGGALLDVVALGELLAALLRELGAHRPLVIAHSSSAPAALELGRSGEQVRGLVLSGAVGGQPERPLWRLLLGRLTDLPREPWVTVRAAAHLLYNVVRHPRSLIAWILAAVRSDLREAAARVVVPVLLAWGQADRTTPVASAQRLASCFPRARLAITRGSHVWMVGRHRRFARLVERFDRPLLRRLASKRTVG